MNSESLLPLIEERLHKSPSGCKATFVKIDKKWGLKLYASKAKRDQNFDTQMVCYEAGYAPEVGDCIDFPEHLDKPYGYFTEIVKTPVPSEDAANRCSRASALVQKWERENEKEMREVKDEIFTLTGFDFTDDHAFNWGYIGQGRHRRLIPIDFGEHDGIDDYDSWEESFCDDEDEDDEPF